MKFWSDVLLCDSMMIHLECQSCRDMHAFSLPFRALSCLSRLSKHHRNLLKYGQSVKRDQTKDDRKNWSWTQNKSRLHFPAASMLFHVPTLHTELLLKSMEKKRHVHKEMQIFCNSNCHVVASNSWGIFLQIHVPYAQVHTVQLSVIELCPTWPVKPVTPAFFPLNLTRFHIPTHACQMRVEIVTQETVKPTTVAVAVPFSST